jgi:hypothetical protein
LGYFENFELRILKGFNGELKLKKIFKDEYLKLTLFKV